VICYDPLVPLVAVIAIVILVGVLVVEELFRGL
jgi:hypothetical protein